MAWGGPRVGAGRKPQPKKEQAVSPFGVVRGGRQIEEALAPPVITDPEDKALCDPPSSLPLDQQAFWREHAPLAIERRTLTPATVPTFRLLCELHAKKVMVGGMVDKGALGGLRVFMQLAKQVESLMARFCLAPFGKPAKAEKPKAAANPWASLASKG